MSNVTTITYTLPNIKVETFSMSQAAKKIGIGRKFLYEFLRQIKWVDQNNFANDDMVAKNFILPKGKKHSGVMVTELGMVELKRLYSNNEAPVLLKKNNRVKFLDEQPEQRTDPELMRSLYNLELLTIDLSKQMEKCFEIAFASKG